MNDALRIALWGDIVLTELSFGSYRPTRGAGRPLSVAVAAAAAAASVCVCVCY